MISQGFILIHYTQLADGLQTFLLLSGGKAYIKGGYKNITGRKLARKTGGGIQQCYPPGR